MFPAAFFAVLNCYLYSLSYHLDFLFYYFTDQDPSSISVEHRNQYTEKELQDILDQYPVTTLINAGNSSESVIFDLCNKILKKSGNKSIFIGQSKELSV